MSIPESDNLLDEVVQRELDQGTIQRYGRGNLYTYFRSRMHIVSRYDLLLMFILKLCWFSNLT